MSVIQPIDLTDPCAVAAKLREVYHALLIGSDSEEVEYSTETGQRRRVRYSKNRLQAVLNALRDAEIECARLQGRVRRFAITAGSRR